MHGVAPLGGIHCLSAARAKVAMDAPIGPQTYARMFPELPSFQADEQFLYALGRAGGLCDCGDTGDSPDSLGNTAAGWPIFGQFVAHDITADRSTLRSHTNIEELQNVRSPKLNLETLYGDGPTGHPFLYQRDDPTAQMCNGTKRVSLLWEIHATIRICLSLNNSSLPEAHWEERVPKPRFATSEERSALLSFRAVKIQEMLVLGNS
jgi:hypothetical protein